MPAADGVIVVDDLIIKQGVPYVRRWTQYANGSLVNFTGYTARMQVRQFLFSSAYIFALSQIDGITLGGAAGTIDLLINATRTALHTFYRGEYNLLLTPPGGNEYVFAEGRTLLDPRVVS